MDQKHPSHEELQSFTHGRLDREKRDAVIAHLSECDACHAQQSQMAMAALIVKMKEIKEHNEQWTCSDPFWGSPYALAPATSPPSKKEIRQWETKHKLTLPSALARALQTQNGGCVRGTDLVICPLGEFQLLSESKWDDVFRFGQIASDRDKLLYIGSLDQVPASVILNYADRSEPSVLCLWHDLGDELRAEADSFDALLGSR